MVEFVVGSLKGFAVAPRFGFRDALVRKAEGHTSDYVIRAGNLFGSGSQFNLGSLKFLLSVGDYRFVWVNTFRQR